MSSQYKVKVGERVMEVEGLAGLVRLVQAGELRPEDPVWVPTTSQWHYAKSIRQLREHFGEESAPKQESVERRKAPQKAPDVDDAKARGQIRAEQPDGEPAGAEIVRFRRGQWSPEGKGVDVPVYTYDVDAEAPPAWPVVRALVMLAGGLFALSLVYLYLHGYDVYLSKTLQKQDAEAVPNRGYVPQMGATPRVTVAAAGAAPDDDAIATAAAITSVAATPAPVATPLFDEAIARERVASAVVTRVTRPGELGDAIRVDLLRIAVPLRAASCDVPKNAKTPRFVCTLDYATTDADAATRARHRFMIVAMTGRRIAELGMKVESVRFRATLGKGKTARTVETRVSAETATGLWSGSASAAALEAEQKP